eukprot:jgi/Mesvir1/8687/Mv02625-RA.1
MGQGSEKGEKFGEKLWMKLRSFYVEAKTLAEHEERTSALCVQELETLLPPADGAPPRKNKDIDHRRKRSRPDLEGSGGGGGGGGSHSNSHVNSGHYSSGNGNGGHSAGGQPIDYWSVEPGDQVVAKISSDSSAADDWILVSVRRVDKDHARFHVVDDEPGDEEEDGDSPQERTYVLPAASIIPLPKCLDPTGTHEWSRGSTVLALFPGTTAFYRARVLQPPSKRKGGAYSLEFDDDEEDGVDGLPQRAIPFKYVVGLPSDHRQ